MDIYQMLAINRQRCERWHPGFPHDGKWNGADWSNAMCGEAGEAANIVKKLRRMEEGMADNLNELTREDMLALLGDELADVFLYAGLLADYFGIDLPSHIVAKFNRVSEQRGFPDRMLSDGGVEVVDVAYGTVDVRPTVWVHCSPAVVNVVGCLKERIPCRCWAGAVDIGEESLGHDHLVTQDRVHDINEEYRRLRQESEINKRQAEAESDVPLEGQPTISPWMSIPCRDRNHRYCLGCACDCHGDRPAIDDL